MKLAKRVRMVFADDSDIHHFYLSNLLPAFPNLELVHMAKDGKGLLSFLEQQADVPDVGIIDLHMPVLDGLSTTRELLQRYPRIRIYGFTSSSDAREKEMMLQAGMCKIYAKNELRELLAEIAACNG
ncbi:response regulator receiver domain-containing protein [Sphingobacterium allocomposti]|uniref:Response regulator receiver domain-containing protein n=1 Tax=Sphingobacterium allocomposti TaxID=415956 RepID=A0A5S5DRU3_9SPHI|nr:response regulator [Sphingobacterium composti Yoo et al. 2007 non Ten et al. 2007]TYP97746.1 response regulator receiver domain-containing protein [Sphingobacterium composti Yoo et al. 2007 non Ten et al. 2007]